MKDEPRPAALRKTSRIAAGRSGAAAHAIRDPALIQSVLEEPVHDLLAIWVERIRKVA
jgi:hypothetical protein